MVEGSCCGITFRCQWLYFVIIMIVIIVIITVIVMIDHYWYGNIYVIAMITSTTSITIVTIVATNMTIVPISGERGRRRPLPHLGEQVLDLLLQSAGRKEETAGPQLLTLQSSPLHNRRERGVVRSAECMVSASHQPVSPDLTLHSGLPG